MAHAIIAHKPGGADVLEWRSIDMPVPKAGEVLIRHTAVGVNFIDIYFRKGLYPWPVESDLTLGAEGAGIVEALGEGVTDFSKGDRVAYVSGNGAYSTHRVVPAASLVKLPDNVSDDIAASAMLKGLTAHYLLHHSYPVKKGDTVLYHAAAGGVGLVIGQWLKAKGVRAIGTAGGAEKCALAKAHGFSDVIDYRAVDFVPQVMELTGGNGVEAVYDSVAADTLAGSLKCLKRFGTLVNFGQSSGPANDFKISDLAAGSLRLTRPTLFHFVAMRDWLESASADLFKVIGDGTVKMAINQQFALEKAADAHLALESRKTTGSTILMP